MVKQEKLIKNTTYLIILYIVFMGCATDTTTSPKKLTLVDATIEVLSKDPENPECWLEYGRASLLSKNPLAAEYAFKRAIDLDKHYLPAYKHLGLILTRQRKFDEAKRYYELALNLWNKDSELWTAYGYCLHDLGLKEDALLAFRKAVKISSDFPSVVSARLGACVLLRRMGRKDAAKHEYQEAAKIYPQLDQLLEKQKKLYRNYFAPKED